MLTVGSLFSGIGGLDLGLERAGMKVIWQSEIDAFACKVLKKHWPEVVNHGDITAVDWRQVERPAVVCGGYPCQPFSTAGNRLGEKDHRHLWPWVRQAISELRPQYAILENVRGHLSLGATTVIADLAAIRYDAEWRIVSAASVGANHKRERIIIVAYPTQQQSHGRQHGNVFKPCAKDWLQSTIRGKSCYDGQSHWQVEPGMGRVADGIPNRVDRLRGLGNAVVPQVAEVIGRLVMAHAGY